MSVSDPALCAAAGVVAGVTTGAEEGAEDDAAWPGLDPQPAPARAAATTAVSSRTKVIAFGMVALPVVVRPSPYSPAARRVEPGRTRGARGST